MRRKKRVGVFVVTFLLCSASFAFASIAILSLPELITPLPHFSNHLVSHRVIKRAAVTPRSEVTATGSRYFLEYKTWRHIQASA